MKALKHSIHALILLTAIRTTKSAGDSGYESSEAFHNDEDAAGPGLSGEDEKSALVSPLGRERRLQFTYVPQWQCVDTKREENEELSFTPEDGFDPATYECICPYTKLYPEHHSQNDYRLCIEPENGRLVLFGPDENEIWGTVSGGTHVRVEDGHVRLLDDNDDIVDSMNPVCNVPQNSQIEFRQTGIFMVDENKNVKWYLTFQGVMSDCNPDTFPEDPCDEVAGEWDDRCRRIAFGIDTGRYHQALFEVKKHNGKLKVTDRKKKIWFRKDKYDRRWRRKGPTSMLASFTKSGGLVVDGKPRPYSCQSIVDGGWQVTEWADNYWVWYDGWNECTDFGKFLLYVMLGYYDDEEGPWDCVSDC